MSAPAGYALNRLAVPMAATAITALPIAVDLILYQGDDFWLDVEVVNPDSTLPDLSAADPRAEIRATAADTTVMATFEASVDPVATNLIHLYLPSAESTNLTRAAVWDVQLSAPYVATLAAGTVTTTPEVTR